MHRRVFCGFVLSLSFFTPRILGARNGAAEVYNQNTMAPRPADHGNDDDEQEEGTRVKSPVLLKMHLLENTSNDSLQQILEAKGVTWTPTLCGISSFSFDKESSTSRNEKEEIIGSELDERAVRDHFLCGTVPNGQEPCVASLVDEGLLDGVNNLTMLVRNNDNSDNASFFVAYSSHPWQSLPSNLTECFLQVAVDFFSPTSHLEVASLHLNQDFSPLPRAVVHAVTAEDVSKAIQCARASGLKVVARGGGHSGMALGVQDDAVVINLEKMDDFQTLDDHALEFLVGAGSRIGKLLVNVAKYGRYVATGFEMGPSVGGQVVGGALGPLAHSHGLGVDFLLGAELVDTNGRILPVSETQHSDLFWALRGAGHSQFGIVTKLHFRSIPMRHVITYELRFDPKLDPTLFQQLWRIMEEFIDSREVFMVLVYEQVAGDDWWLGLKGTVDPSVFDPVGVDAASAGTSGTVNYQDPERIFRFLNITHLKPLQMQETIRYLSWLEASALWSGVSDVSELVTRAHECVHKRWVSHSGFSGPILTGRRDTQQDNDESGGHPVVVDKIWEAFHIPTPDMVKGNAYFAVTGNGGAVTDVAVTAMAYPYRQRGLTFSLAHFWESEDDGEKVLDWHYQVLSAMEPLRAKGGYANHVMRALPNFFEENRPVHEHYYGENSRRLEWIKALYDPHMVFSHPMSIRFDQVCSLEKQGEGQNSTSNAAALETADPISYSSSHIHSIKEEECQARS